MEQMVTTIHGDMPVSALEHRETVEDTPGGTVRATEYWLNGVLVHRSVEIGLKGQEFKFEGGFGNG